MSKVSRPAPPRSAARRSAHLLTYSLLSLAGVTLLAAVAGWIVAGRILRPVHRLTAAARTASEQNLTQRIALQGPRDELRELADTFDTMLERLDHAFTSQRQFIANASHELRTPLTVMRTAVDVVLAKPQPTRDELVSMAADVRQAVDHASGSSRHCWSSPATNRPASSPTRWTSPRSPRTHSRTDRDGSPRPPPRRSAGDR